jgi:hypothetical protein
MSRIGSTPSGGGDSPSSGLLVKGSDPSALEAALVCSELLAGDPLPTTQLAMDAIWRAYGWPSCLYSEGPGRFKQEWFQ